MGDVSAAAVCTRGFISPLATSTSERSALGQSSGLGLRVCEKTMVLPFGDQSNGQRPVRAPSPGRLSLPFVNSLGSRCNFGDDANGKTYRRFILIDSSTTRTSLFSLAALSSSAVGGSRAINAIDWPSGDHLKLLTAVAMSVSCTASPPPGLMAQRFFLPPRLETKAIHFPSGDHCGSSHDLSPCVSCKTWVPSALARYRCVRYSLVSPSMTA